MEIELLVVTTCGHDGNCWNLTPSASNPPLSVSHRTHLSLDQPRTSVVSPVKTWPTTVVLVFNKTEPHPTCLREQEVTMHFDGFGFEKTSPTTFTKVSGP